MYHLNSLPKFNWFLHEILLIFIWCHKTHPDDGLSDEHWVDERLVDLHCDSRHSEIDELVLALIYSVVVDDKNHIHCRIMKRKHCPKRKTLRCRKSIELLIAKKR